MKWNGGGYKRFAATSEVVSRRLWGGGGERPKLVGGDTREATAAALEAVCGLIKVRSKRQGYQRS